MRLICTAPLLPPGTHLVAEGGVLVHVDANGTARATPNRCAHQAARFGKPDGCVFTCGMHGWQLDVSQMRYRPPHQGVEQPQYVVEQTPDGLRILDTLPPPPWADVQPRRELLPAAFTVELGGSEVIVRPGGPPLHWTPEAPAGRFGLERWHPLGPAGRVMWLPAVVPEHTGLLVELVGHRLLLVDGALDTELPPSPVDLLVATGDEVESLAIGCAPRSIATDDPRPLRSLLRGTPIWPIRPGLVLDVATGRPPPK